MAPFLASLAHPYASFHYEEAPLVRVNLLNKPVPATFQAFLDELGHATQQEGYRVFLFDARGSDFISANCRALAHAWLREYRQVIQDHVQAAAFVATWPPVQASIEDILTSLAWQDVPRHFSTDITEARRFLATYLPAQSTAGPSANPPN